MATWRDLVLDIIQEGILVIDNKWQVVFANDTVAHFAGKDKQSLIGQNPWRNIKLLKEGRTFEHIHELAEFSAESIASLQGSYDLQIESDFLRIELYGRYVHQSEQAIFVLRDVTKERKRLEDFQAQQQKLEEALLKNEALVESIGEGLVSVNANGTIETVNRAALNLLGFKASDLIGEWFPRVIKSFDDNGPVEPFDQPLVRALTEGKPVSSVVYIEKKDGTQIPVAATASPLMADDRPVGAIVVFRDYSKEREVDRMKSEFISLASHQLRTPLSAIMLYANMLNEGYAGVISKDQKEFVQTIMLTVDRMVELVNTLLNISRIESGRIMIKPAPTNLEAAYKQIAVEQTPRMKEKKISFNLEVEADLAEINIDPGFLKEIFSNLLSNAVKYTKEGGQINAKIYKKNSDVITEIKDTGMGIPKLEQEKIFSKFYRGSNVVSYVTEGTGLGTYVIKSLVEAMGGKIWFESQENKGTTFWFSLPLSGVKAKPGIIAQEGEK